LNILLLPPLSDHPHALLPIVVLDKEEPSPIVLACSREDVLPEQILISLGVEPVLEDGEAAGAAA